MSLDLTGSWVDNAVEADLFGYLPEDPMSAFPVGALANFIDVSKPNGTLYLAKLEDQLRKAPSDLRDDSGRPGKVHQRNRTVTFNTDERGLEVMTRKRDMDAAAYDVREANRGYVVNQSVNAMLNVVAGKLFATSSWWKSTHYTSPATAWSSDASDPVSDVESLLNTIHLATNMVRGNAAVGYCNDKVARRLRTHPRFTMVGGVRTNLRPELSDIAAVMGLRTIHVLDAVQVTSNVDASSTTNARIGGDHFGVMIQATETPSLESLAAAPVPFGTITYRKLRLFNYEKSEIPNAFFDQTDYSYALTMFEEAAGGLIQSVV